MRVAQVPDSSLRYVCVTTNEAAALLDSPGLREHLSVALVVPGEVLRRRLRVLLERNGLRCSLEVEYITELLSHTLPRRIDVIVLRPDGTRTQIIETFKSARAAYPNTPLVGLWPNDLRSEDPRVLKAGVDGLLQESQIETALGATIHAVCSGLLCFPRRPSASIDGQSLSSREKQVLGMLIMGFTNAEIARRLYLAESTVKSHLSSAYMKLGVRSRKDAAALILDPDEGLGTGILAISGPNR